MQPSAALPPGLHVFERGWLSSNNILFLGSGPAALVDSGYCTHSSQTLALVERALRGRSLELLLNTHLHSDHCGGNAALQARYGSLQTLIPPGEADAIASWDEQSLSYLPTGQLCPRFSFDALLQPGITVQLADQHWEVHAAPGHDVHSVILFEPGSRTLISADALWSHGFGIVFPEVVGHSGFDEVSQTLDLIERLDPQLVIPGHGPVFTDVHDALSRARSRLEGFVASPHRHARHAAKVLIKFKLLERQSFDELALRSWILDTPYLQMLHKNWGHGESLDQWLAALIDDLVRAGAARLAGNVLHDA